MKSKDKESLKEEILGLSRKLKGTFIVLIVLVVGLTFVACQQYGPKPEFIRNMDQTADRHLEAWQKTLEMSGEILKPEYKNVLLEYVNDKEKGYYDEDSEQARKDQREQLVDEIKATRADIRAAVKELEGMESNAN